MRFRSELSNPNSWSSFFPFLNEKSKDYISSSLCLIHGITIQTLMFDLWWLILSRFNSTTPVCPSHSALRFISPNGLAEMKCWKLFAVVLSLCSHIPIVNVFVTSPIGLRWVWSPFMSASARCCLSLFYLFGNWRWRREAEMNCVTKMICEWWTEFFTCFFFSFVLHKVKRPSMKTQPVRDFDCQFVLILTNYSSLFIRFFHFSRASTFTAHPLDRVHQV